jgi:hypothetical protein
VKSLEIPLELVLSRRPKSLLHKQFSLEARVGIGQFSHFSAPVLPTPPDSVPTFGNPRNFLQTHHFSVPLYRVRG